MKTVLWGMFFFGLLAVSYPASADIHWLDSRDNTSLPHYRTAEEACAVGEAQRRLDGYRASVSLPLRYRPVYVGPDDGFNERPCRTVIEKKLVFVGWVTIETVDTLVHGPNGSPDACNITGLSDPDTGQCGSPKRPACCSGIQGNGSDPIHSASGNKYQVETDFVGGGPWPLRFTRTYNSYMTVNNRPAPMGTGWTHNYMRSIVSIASTYGGSAEVVYAYRPDGGILTFTRSGSAWVGDPDSPERLSGTTEGGVPSGWTLRTADDDIESYDRTGRLVSIKNRDGFVHSLSYAGALLSKVTGPDGRAIIFAYDGSGRLSSITESDGTIINYTYDGSGNLATVEYPYPGSTSHARTYTYNETGQTGGINQPNALTGIVDENQQRYASWVYDANHRATLSVQGAYDTGTIDRTALDYSGTDFNTITDALGQQRAAGFTVKYGVPHLATLDQPCSYCGAIGASASYDANGYPSQSVDFRGTQTQYSYDSRGLETQRVEAVGTPIERTVQTDWHATLRVPTERRVLDASAVLAAKTAWVYNSRGQVLARCEIDPAAAATYVCAATGVPPAGVRRWTYSYCDAVGGQCPLMGLLRSVDGPRTDLSDVTTYAYYTATDESGCSSLGGACHRAGDLHTITDALGHATTFAAYDKVGHVSRKIDSNGVVTDFTYHPRGWLTNRTIRANAGARRLHKTRSPRSTTTRSATSSRLPTPMACMPRTPTTSPIVSPTSPILWATPSTTRLTRLDTRPKRKPSIAVTLCAGRCRAPTTRSVDWRSSWTRKVAPRSLSTTPTATART